MYIVICPQCEKRLKLKEPMEKKKFKCSACGNVFIGTAQPADSVPAAKAKPPKADRPAEPPPGPPDAVGAAPVAMPDLAAVPDASAPAAEPVESVASAAAPAAPPDEPKVATSQPQAEPPHVDLTPAPEAPVEKAPAAPAPAEPEPAQPPQAAEAKTTETKSATETPAPQAAEKKADGFSFDFAMGDAPFTLPDPVVEKPAPAKPAAKKPARPAADANASQPTKAAPASAAAAVKPGAKPTQSKPGKPGAKPAAKPAASSKPLADDVPREAAAIMSAVGVGRTARSRTVPTVRTKSIVPFIVVGSCALLIIPLVICIWYFSTHRHFVLDGHDYGYLPLARIKELEEEASKPKPVEPKSVTPAPTPPPVEGNGPGDTTVAAGNTAVNQPAFFNGPDPAKDDPGTSDDPPPKPEPTPPGDDEPVQAVANTGEIAALPEDGGIVFLQSELEEVLKVELKVVPPKTEDGKYALIGTVKNGSDVAIEQLSFRVALKDKNDDLVDEKTGSIAFIPTESVAPVFVDLGNPVDKTTPTVIVEVTEIDPLVATVWEICDPAKDVSKDDLRFTAAGDGEMKVTGTVLNRTPRDLVNVHLWVDVYLFEGGLPPVWLGTGQITPAESSELGNLPRNKEARIEATFECARAGEKGLRYYIRATGMKPDDNPPSFEED